MEPLPKTKRMNEYLIVGTDYLSKWAEAAAVKKYTNSLMPVRIPFVFSTNPLGCG
jgi:hypothetical protein